MRNSFLPLTLFALAHCCFAGSILATAHRLPAQDRAAKVAVDFARDIRPILSDKCFACHGPDASSRKADLRLDQPNSAVQPGDLRGSELYRRITHTDRSEIMPPPSSHKSLDAEQITMLARWIESGATYERHWSLDAPVRRAPPAIRDSSWARNFVDAWIASEAATRGYKVSPPADARSLLRRLSLDLRGLPPSPDEVRAFVADPSDAAYRALVERFLDSDAHAERLAVWWLDLVRYADTVGYHGDQEHAISPYRDWVLRALREDMPFDRFTELQLAGDLQDEPSESDQVASGYNRVLQTTHEGGAQPKEYLAIYNADRVRNFGAVWLGLTTGCAQCHDHKFDPISIRDFYSLGAFFADITEVGDFKGSPNSTPTTRPPELLLLDDANRKRLSQIDRKITALRNRRAKAKGSARRKLDTRWKELHAQRKRITRLGRYAMITKAREKPRTMRVLPRGNWLDDSGPVVLPAVPAVFPQIRKEGRATRRDLARWLFEPEHPLTARVVVNRLWAMLFGTGLSRHLADLGSQGEWPEHRELLDALAVEFREKGWSLRHILRLLVSSASYRQTSAPRDDVARVDPDNRLHVRQSAWRLPAEFVRDNALAIAGLLECKTLGGPSIKPAQPAGYYRHLNFPPRRYKADKDIRQWRRSVYVHWQRQFLHPFLLAFDAPTREESCSERARSNSPQAALALLGDASMVEAAFGFGKLLHAHRGSDEQKIEHGFVRALARPATEREQELLASFLIKERARLSKDPAAARTILGARSRGRTDGNCVERAAWWSVARALLNLAETSRRP